jgi:hypothetical protein
MLKNLIQLWKTACASGRLSGIKILPPDSSDADKIHNLSELYKTCDEWLRPLMEMERAGQ